MHAEVCTIVQRAGPASRPTNYGLCYRREVLQHDLGWFFDRNGTKLRDLSFESVYVRHETVLVQRQMRRKFLLVSKMLFNVDLLFLDLVGASERRSGGSGTHTCEYSCE